MTNKEEAFFDLVENLNNRANAATEGIRTPTAQDDIICTKINEARSANCDFNQKNPYGLKLLPLAVYNLHSIHIINKLIECGASAKTEGLIGILLEEKDGAGCYTEAERRKLLEAFIDLGASIDEAFITYPARTKETPLSYASKQGDLETVKTLLERGAKIIHQGVDAREARPRYNLNAAAIRKCLTRAYNRQYGIDSDARNVADEERAMFAEYAAAANDDALIPKQGHWGERVTQVRHESRSQIER